MDTLTEKAMLLLCSLNNKQHHGDGVRVGVRQQLLFRARDIIAICFLMLIVS